MAGVELRVPDWLRQRAASTPTRTALLADDDAWSFAELDRVVDGACVLLEELGVRAGDRIGVRAANSAGFVFAVHALALRGSLPELAANLRCAFDPADESIATVWRELREDYLQTLGYAQEAERI